MSIELNDLPPVGVRPSVDGGQRLNPADCALLSVDRTLREMGCPGFETQMLVWLSARADAAGLRRALGHLSRSYPVVASRLMEADERGRSHWQFRPGAECPLAEIDLDSAEVSAVMDCAGRLLSTPCDPAKVDPIRFYLLHMPDRRDVFLLQYNHTLMDINAMVPLVREIDRCCRGSDSPPTALPAAAELQRDVLWTHLRRFPRKRRKAAMRRTLEVWWQCLRGGAALLGQAHPAGASPTHLRLAARQLDVSQTRALQSRVIAVCGFPSFSMALMASAFRAIDRLAPPRANAGNACVAGIGLDLGLRDKKSLVFGNLVSVVPMRAPLENLGDRDELMRFLSRQMRDLLAQETDLGMLQWTAALTKRQRQTRWVLDLALKTAFSLWYAYFGALDAIGDQFAGAAIEEVFFTGPSWSPMGITLLANQFRGRLFLQATYVPESVPAELANEFLDAVVGDLVG